jgi:gamma-glutamyltranspeptidase/glutathione hydrolase
MIEREPAFYSRRSPVYATRGIVASSQPLASQAGLEILMQGGNAADAAIATAAALNVTEPCSTGLGGDCFALFYDAATGEVSALNGSGRAPAALTIDLLREQGINMHDEEYFFHALMITVPGACAGWCDLIERHGRLDMTAILAPAIRLADEGFPVEPLTAHAWDYRAGLLARAPGGQALLIDGRAPRAGEIMRNPALGNTLRIIARGGKNAFYRGEIAHKIEAAVQNSGGVMTVDDLAAHTSTWETPISTTYGGVRVHECPPNGQGLAALIALNILSHFDLPHPLSVERLHLLIEALRLAFADTRRYVADPAQTDVPLEALLSSQYAAQRAKLIDLARATPDRQPGSPAAGSDTVYLSVVDGQGNACSFINSNYMGFGTGIVPQGTGFSLQNRGHAFVLDPAHPNSLAPGKRPYHTIIPGMATRAADGSLYACFGVMGGFMQPQGHVQVLLALIDDGLDPQSALDRPRLCIEDGTAGGRVALEEGIPLAVMAKLAEMGHDVRPVSGYERVVFGRGQIITRDPRTGVLCGGSEPRADGCAIGY